MSKIKTNTVSNLKALKDLQVNFNGCSAIITGRNNSGKSSFLKSLPDRLRGIKPDIILKVGEDEGFQEIELTTGEIFRWVFDNKTAKGERLTFITKAENGDEIKGSITEAIANKYFPATFDVDKFLNSSPQKQKKMLEELSGLDFTVINDRHKVAYDERTYANKKLSDAKANLKPILNNLPTLEHDVLSIQTEISGLDSHNREYATAKRGVDELNRQVTETDTEIKRLNTLIKAANDKKSGLEKRIKDGNKWLETAANQPKSEDVSYGLNKKLQERIDENVKIKANNDAIKAKEDVLQLEINAKQYDAAVKKIELEKVEMIKKSNMPQGFGFTDDGITYNGLPFTKEQLSSSGIYIAALKLAAKMIGEVKTLHFDASFLDKNSLAEIENWAITEGEKLFGEPLQLLIERPDFEAGEIRYELITDIK